MQDPADRRRRRFPETFARQMPGDRHRARVRPGSGQLATQLDDPVAHDLGRLMRAGPRPARARRQSVQAALPVADQQTVQVPAGKPVLGRSLSNRQLLGNDLQDSDVSTRHAPARWPAPRTMPAAIAIPAQPYGLSLHADHREHLRPMSRLMSDLPPGTHVVNPDTTLRLDAPLWLGFFVLRRARSGEQISARSERWRPLSSLPETRGRRCLSGLRRLLNEV